MESSSTVAILSIQFSIAGPQRGPAENLRHPLRCQVYQGRRRGAARGAVWPNERLQQEHCRGKPCA